MYISIHNFTFLCSLYNLEDRWGGEKKANRKGKEMPNKPEYIHQKNVVWHKNERELIFKT